MSGYISFLIDNLTFMWQLISDEVFKHIKYTIYSKSYTEYWLVIRMIPQFVCHLLAMAFSRFRY